MIGIVGIDLDSKNMMRLLKTYFNAKALCKGKEPDVRSTERGFHLRIPKRTSLWRHHEVRLMLSDCKGRMAFDELKLDMGLTELYDTLFESKKGEDGRWYSEEPCNVLSEPFWNARIGIKRRCYKKWLRKRR